MTTFAHDIRVAARSLRRTPAFASLAVLVLAVGIGATSGTFSLIDATLFRPLPYRDPAQLVMLRERPPGGAPTRVSPLNFIDWSEQTHAFQHMAAVAGLGRVLTGVTGAAERVPSQSVTPAFFDVFGVTPVAGRTFVAADAAPGTHVVVIGERFWRDRLAGDASAIGRVLRLDGEPFTIVGIVPAAFQVLGESDLWVPFALRRSPEQRRLHYLEVVARLKPGRGIEDARADMALVADTLARIAPETNKNWTVAVDPLRRAIVGAELKTTSLVLAGVVGFVLLMSCANVASLLLARGAGRAREIAVRRAIGGTHVRILRLLVTESLLIAALGGIAGMFAAWVVIRLAPSALPADMLPEGITLQFDIRVGLFAAVITGLTGMLAGLAPAWRSARTPLTEALSSGARSSTTGGRLRWTLTVAEIAGAVVLLSGAGLLVRTLIAMTSEEHGFRGDSVLTMSVGLPFNRYPNPDDVQRFYRRAETEMASIPNVQAVGIGNNLPLLGWNMGQPIEIAGDAPVDPSSRPAAHYQMVNPGYFSALGISFVKGRAFDEHDRSDSRPVSIVNEEFVRRHLRGREPIGTIVKVPNVSWQGGAAVEREIVGVIRQVSSEPGEIEKAVEIYVPLEQNAWYSAAIAIRTTGDPMRLAPLVRAAVARIDADLPVTRVRTMNQAAGEAVRTPRFRAGIVAAFATIALLLASTGIFGLLTFSVSQRSRELGIRMALGARGADVLRLILREAAQLTGAGLVLGLVLAAGLTRSLQSLLYGVTPLDAVTYAATAAVLASAALVAGAFPALTAARTDPAVTLRRE